MKMQQIKELERELERKLETKGEELGRIREAEAELVTLKKKKENELEESKEQRPLVFADAELDKSKLAQKQELKERITRLKEEIEDIGFAITGLDRKAGEPSRELRELESRKKMLERDLEEYKLMQVKYKEAYADEKRMYAGRAKTAINRDRGKKMSPVKVWEYKLRRLAAEMGITRDLQKFFEGVEKEFGKLEEG